jgi:hypothetical protein
VLSRILYICYIDLVNCAECELGLYYSAPLRPDPLLFGYRRFPMIRLTAIRITKPLFSELSISVFSPSALPGYEPTTNFSAEFRRESRPVQLHDGVTTKVH